jgi:hypothetical protein
VCLVPLVPSGAVSLQLHKLNTTTCRLASAGRDATLVLGGVDGSESADPPYMEAEGEGCFVRDLCSDLQSVKNTR